MDSEERVIALDDGARTTVEQWGDSGPVLLCVHGMTSSRRSWARVATHYANRFRVVAYDQRGHGDSAAIHGPMTLERAVADLREVAFRLDAPIRAVIGHSWGGAVAIIGAPYVAAEPVVALDPMIRQAADEWYDEYLMELSETSALRGAEREARTRRDFADWPPEDVEAKVHAVHDMSTVPIARLGSENAAEVWDLRDLLSRYDRPLLLAFAGDGINDAATMTDVERKHGELVDVRVFEHLGHNLHRTDLYAVLEAIDPFM